MLQYCRDNGIQVIAYSPPFMPTIYQSMMASGNYTYLAKQSARLNDLVTRYGGSYFDFTDVAPLGLTDQDFYDGWHPLERVDLQIYVHMLDTLPDSLGRYSDPEFLRQASDSTALVTIFGNQFAP